MSVNKRYGSNSNAYRAIVRSVGNSIARSIRRNLSPANVGAVGAAVAANIAARSNNTSKSKSRGRSGRRSKMSIRKSSIISKSGYSGRIPGNLPGGYLRKRKRWLKAPPLKSLKYGAMLKYETGSTINDSECVYIGHGLPIEQTWLMVVRELIKDLFEEGGFLVADLNTDEVIHSGDTGNTHEISISYYSSTIEETLTEVTINPPAGSTIYSIAASLITALETSLGSVMFQSAVPIFHRLRYTKYVTASVNVRTNVANLWLDKYSLNIYFKSNLKMQNITPAGAATAETGEDRYSAGDIENVTLYGKGYKTPGWQNYFPLLNRVSKTATSTGLVSNYDTGLILNTYSSISQATGGNENYKKPPSPQYLGANKFDKVVVPPGKVYRDKILWNTTIGLNKYMAIMTNSIKDSFLNASNVKLGLAHVFAFEKMIDMRIATDSNVTIGYEIDWEMKVKGKSVKPMTTPFVYTA